MKENVLISAIAELYNKSMESQSVIGNETSALVDLLLEFGYAVIREFKFARSEDQEKNPNFRYWTHICSIERGTAAVTVRWRKYSGKAKFSDPIGVTEMIDFQLPAKAFKKCTKNEKKAIRQAELKFKKIRQISWHLSRANESIRAVRDITQPPSSSGAVALGIEFEEKRILDAFDEIDRIGRQTAAFDKAAVRRSLGL